MNKRVVGETYDAFKARKRKDFDSRHAERPLVIQQRLLRVHLQHFLLTVGAEVGQERKRNEVSSNSVNCDENQAVRDDGVDARRSFASEQKRLAVAREAAKNKRHRSARTIQSFVRRHQRFFQEENEEELVSTSVLIPIESASSVVVPQAIVTNNIPTNGYIAPVDPPPTAALPLYEVVIEVVAARDLALGSASVDGKYIETEMLLNRHSAVIARVIPTKQFVSSFQESCPEIQLHDCSLRYALDLNNGMRHGIASPQSVIDELSATVIVKATDSNDGGNPNTLGVVGIPLSLLETPLASEYALFRWFPLEKVCAGHTARGDLRVSLCYLMRQTGSDSPAMVPYVSTIGFSNAIGEAEVQQERKKPIARRMKKKAPPTAATERKVERKSFGRKREKAGKSDKLKSPVLSLKASMASPIGRISRAEALSPPPSPSSATSSETGDNVDPPTNERQAKPGRRFFPPKRKGMYDKPVESSPPMEEPEPPVTTKPLRSPPKFLKRKPYKVVFQKLDWSGVASKTDSNLPTSGNSSRVNSGVAARPLKTSRSATRASESLVTASDSGDAGTNMESVIIPKPGAFIDAATADRISALEAVMYERCCVTRETASLARFKYQAERKKFVATLQSQPQARINGNSAVPDQPPSQENSEHQNVTTTSEGAVTELWKKLTSDSSGRVYVSMLRSLTERPAEPEIDAGS